MTSKQRAAARAALTAALVAAAACSGRDSGQPESPFERGEKIYENVCIACHHADPSQVGLLGPPIAGSSRELIEHRVLHGTYPPGYQPQRASKQMPLFPHLADYVDDLEVYLAEAGS